MMNDHVRIIEHQKFTIVTNSKKTPIELIVGVTGLNLSEDKTNVRINKLLINGEDYSSKIEKPEVIREGNLKSKTLKFFLELEGNCKEYVVEKEICTIHSNKLNIFWRRDITRYTDHFQIGIKENPDLEIDFVPFGQLVDFREIAEPVYKGLKVHKGLLVPGEGYIIFVK